MLHAIIYYGLISGYHIASLLDISIHHNHIVSTFTLPETCSPLKNRMLGSNRSSSPFFGAFSSLLYFQGRSPLVSGSFSQVFTLSMGFLGLGSCRPRGPCDRSAVAAVGHVVPPLLCCLGMSCYEPVPWRLEGGGDLLADFCWDIF